MELELTDDQQLFWETTRKFLETSTPLTVVREIAAREPGRIRPGLVATRGGVGLDVDACPRGSGRGKRLG